MDELDNIVDSWYDNQELIGTDEDTNYDEELDNEW